MYVSMYICMYVYVSICRHAHAFTCVRTYLCPYVRMYGFMYVRTYVCMYVCMYVRTYVCMHVSISTYVRTHAVCMYLCTYLCTYVHVCMYGIRIYLSVAYIKAQLPVSRNAREYHILSCCVYKDAACLLVASRGSTTFSSVA